MLFLFTTPLPIAPPVVITPGYLDPNELIAYIRAYNVANGDPWRDAGFAADLAYVEANDRIIDPAVFVVPGPESSRDISDMKVIRQIITCSVRIVTVVRHYRIDSGESAHNTISPLRLLVRNHVIGFRPSGFDNSLRHAGANLRSFTDELQVWVDEFSADFHFQKYIN